MGFHCIYYYVSSGKHIFTDKEEKEGEGERGEKLGACFGLLCLHYQESSLRHIEGNDSECIRENLRPHHAPYTSTQGSREKTT